VSYVPFHPSSIKARKAGAGMNDDASDGSHLDQAHGAANDGYLDSQVSDSKISPKPKTINPKP